MIKVVEVLTDHNVVTIGHIKHLLRLTADADDEIIEQIIHLATDVIERYVGLGLQQRVVEVPLVCLTPLRVKDDAMGTISSAYRLPLSPVAKVISVDLPVESLGESGGDSSLSLSASSSANSKNSTPDAPSTSSAVGDYTLVNKGEHSYLVFTEAAVRRIGKGRLRKAVVRYIGGYESLAAIPPALHHAIAPIVVQHYRTYVDDILDDTSSGASSHTSKGETTASAGSSMTSFRGLLDSLRPQGLAGRTVLSW